MLYVHQLIKLLNILNKLVDFRIVIYFERTDKKNVCVVYLQDYVAYKHINIISFIRGSKIVLDSQLLRLDGTC